MVQGAVKGLGDRKGSSLKAIKKYIVETYHADAEKLAPFIRRHLKSGVEKGELVQTKGMGANGSFKLPPKGGAKKESNPVAKKKASSPKTAKVAKKPAGTKNQNL